MAHSPMTPRALRNLSEVREVRKKERSTTPEVDLTSRKLNQIAADWLSFKVHSRPRLPKTRPNRSPSPKTPDPINSKRLQVPIKAAPTLLHPSRSLSTPRSKLLFEKRGKRSSHAPSPTTFTMVAKLKQFAVDLTSADVERGRKRKPKTLEVSLYD
mmetsp:Transcript_21822/g.39787  ORF Transcript_21822/g.39787 Transcript_21822/m.39787 type:complete len:156 (+) Transcript_21822:756-1223(+)